MTLTACDVSEWQTAVNNAYPHRWLIFRVLYGATVDQRCEANLAWAKKAKASGRLDGYTVYVVWLPGENKHILAELDSLHVPTDCHVMIDVESWKGSIRGDHSAEITSLANSLAARQGSKDRVWAYANRGDLNNIYPHRPAWLGLVIAAYGSDKPSNPGPGPLAGWQYTDGTYASGNRPTSSDPFGHCDHNELYITAQPEGLTMEPDVKARFDKIDAFNTNFWASYMAVVGVDTNSDGKRDFTGSIQRACEEAIRDMASPTLAALKAQIAALAKQVDPAAIAAAVYVKLPPAAKGGITQADVTTAVKAALQEGTGK